MSLISRSNCLFHYSRFIAPKQIFYNSCIRTFTKTLNNDIGNDSLRKTRVLPSQGPDLKHFIVNSVTSVDNEVDNTTIESVPYLDSATWQGFNRKVYFDIYGCQMNVSDVEVVWSILQSAGFSKTDDDSDADIVLIMTCAIREGAENKIWNRLKYLRFLKQRKRKGHMKVGILGCMAERLKETLIEKEKIVDLVAGPDSYRDLPRLLAITENNQSAVNVLLSLDETYADIMPVRINDNSISAFVSIMRGCDNMCTYCIVPFTRGRERSRPIESIITEIKKLSDDGIKEVTLLGQNVNSYRDTSQESFYCSDVTNLAKGFQTVYKSKKGGLRFADLLDRASQIDPNMRIRFTSPHPKDFPDELLQLISERSNICNSLHLPAQSGNSRILEKMRRGYTREAYLELVQNVYKVIPDVALSSDFICGFCSETDEEFQDTISLMREVEYTTTFLFAYSMREKTTAHRRYIDDVPQDVKLCRLAELNRVFRELATKKNKSFVGQIQLILVEGRSKRSEQFLAGRNDGNQVVIIPATEVPLELGGIEKSGIKTGNYVAVKINESSSQVLKGIPLYHSSIVDFRTEESNKYYASAI